MLKRLFVVPFFLLLTVAVIAQESECPALVQQALDYIAGECSSISRNQACYGNLQVNAVPAPDASSFKFDTPGDITDLVSIQSLSLSALTLPDTWGVMLMSVQADLPESVPGQNVTMLLFGDVQIENKGGTAAPILLDAAAKSNARVRSGPGTQNGQIGSLSGGDAVKADGRNEAGDWLRVQIADGTSGWVSAELVTVTGDVSTLPVVEGTEIGGTTYGPMQAFYFTSGVGTSSCNGVPQDGILIQTPEGAGKVDLLINEVQVSVGSTIYTTAQASNEMELYVLEGGSSVESAGKTVNIPAGAKASIPLDENGVPNGEPVLETYDDAAVAVLATMLPVLPQQIEPAPALDLSTLVVVPQAGPWHSVTAPAPMTCTAEGFTQTITTPGGSSDLILTADENAITVTQADGVLPPPLIAGGTGTYSASFTSNEAGISVSVIYTLTVISPTEMSGVMEMSGACSGTMTFTMNYTGG